MGTQIILLRAIVSFNFLQPCIMKKYSLLLISIFLFIQSNACPFCGCGVGNFYLGLLPNFKSAFVGVRYSYAQYHTNIAGDAAQFGDDYYNTPEIWGGINLGKHWQVLAFVPYHINKQVSDDGTKKQNGVGDISMLANYKLYSTYKFHNKKGTAHEVWIGGGLKLPVGKFSADLANTEELIAEANSQLGTGSVDFLLNAAYNFRVNSFGVNTAVNYKINTTNKDQYYFGNRFSASSFAYYQLNAGKTGITPNIGLLYEHAAANILSSTKVDLSGGYAAYAAAGVDFTISKISLGVSAQVPVSQDFAAGQTKSKFRGIAHITFAL